MKTFAITITLFVLCLQFSAFKGTCPAGCKLPITIYNDLKCRAIYASENACCPSEFDCSHIYNHTGDSCHFKGKRYKPGQTIEEEDYRGSCDQACECQSGPLGPLFHCPEFMDGCAEDWVGGYPQPLCYLRREPNSCCASGEICPPFEGNAKCEVHGKIYEEGELFDHPTHKCNQCSCKKGFDGKFKEPFCEEIKCYAEIKNSGDINNYCAPFYGSIKSCCPNKWICLNKSGKFLPPINDRATEAHLKCKFGKEIVDIGKRYQDDSQEGKVYCECVVPPLMTCGPEPFKA